MFLPRSRLWITILSFILSWLVFLTALPGMQCSSSSFWKWLNCSSVRKDHLKSKLLKASGRGAHHTLNCDFSDSGRCFHFPTMYFLLVSWIKSVHHGWVEIQFLFNAFYKKKKKEENIMYKNPASSTVPAQCFWCTVVVFYLFLVWFRVLIF